MAILLYIPKHEFFYSMHLWRCAAHPRARAPRTREGSMARQRGSRRHGSAVGLELNSRQVHRALFGCLPTAITACLTRRARPCTAAPIWSDSWERSWLPGAVPPSRRAAHRVIAAAGRVVNQFSALWRPLAPAQKKLAWPGLGTSEKN